MLLVFPCLCAIQIALQGQNPFDLEWRKPKVDTTTQMVDAVSKNPFDVVPHRVPQRSDISPEKTKGAASSTFWDLKRLGTEPKSFLFWLVFFNLAVLAAVVALSRGGIVKAWNAFINNNQFALLFRDWTNGQLSVPYLILYLNFILNIGFFGYLALKFINNNEVGGIRLLLLCVVLSALLFSLKHIILSVIGKIFPLKEAASKYSFLMASANISIGLFLVPFNLLISFVAGIQGFLIFWVISLIAIFYLLRAFRALSFSGKLFASDKFHFLLYLCTLEILPILLIAKVIWTNII